MKSQAASFQFWGLRGVFSTSALSTLLAAGLVPQVVVLPDQLPGRSITRLTPATHLSLPIHAPAGSPDILHLAAQHHIPVLAVSDLKHPETIATLAETRPEIALVACFNRRIPAEILAIPRYGFLNIHPALLPAYRGPAPLFWLFRDAATAAMGVTVHQMDTGLDTGDIIAQQPQTFPDGVSGREADQICARVGAGLIADMWVNLSRGIVTTRKQSAGGSVQSWPTSADFTLDPTWPARRAFNFMRATAEWQMPYPITVGSKTIRLKRAIAFQPDTPVDGFQVEGDVARIRFRPGVLQATLHTT